MTTRSLTLLNGAGHQTIVWSEESDETMLAMIEKKMAEGVSFFIVEPRFFGLLPPKETRLEGAKQALASRAVTIKDRDIAKLYLTGEIEIVKPVEAPAGTTRRAKTAKEVASGHSVAVRPFQGG